MKAISIAVLASLLSTATAFPAADAVKRETVSSGAFEVVQAQVPPRSNYNNPACQQEIFNYNFASSYGIPYVGSYKPPTNCEYTTTIFNISVTSTGRQYDRLALLFLGDTEVWRTSTAMPSEDGIFWTYQKDMTIFDTLLREDQKVIFDLSNVYSDVYTGAYNVTLEAFYFNDVYEDLDPADFIYPISALASAQNISSVMSLPDDNGTVSLTFPPNVKTAVVSLLASGNSAEEFWYTNVPTEYVDTFPSNPGWLYGYSPFRELELLIDGELAGVSWPFPLLFTGGVDPGLWRPIAGVDSYDLPTFEIDVTPWLGLLCDGNSHTFGIKVVGYDSDVEGNLAPIGQNWWVTGSVFVWLDEAGTQTTGTAVQSSLPAPDFEFLPEVGTITESNRTTNTSFYFSLSAARNLSISSTITTSNGTKSVSWTQDLTFQNIQNMTSEAYNQSLAMVSTGTFSNSLTTIPSTYSYPLNLFSFYVIAPTSATLSSVYALIDRSLLSTGINTLPYLTGTSTGSETLATRQNATSNYYWNETIVEGTSADVGITEQWFSFEGAPGNGMNGTAAYSRRLREMDDVLVLDHFFPATMVVPPTIALPVVEGEPSV